MKIGIGSRARLTRRLAKQCGRTLERFRKLAPPEWSPRSLLTSEAFALCAVSDLCKADMLIESGTYEGRSAEIFASYLRHPVFTIDVTMRDEARERLKRYQNVLQIHGSGLATIERLLDLFPSRRIGLFVDGPKGLNVVDWSHEILGRKNVVFAAIHDLHAESGGEPNPRRLRFDELEPAFATDEPWFVDAYASLDEGESDHHDEEQDLVWEPHRFRRKDGTVQKELGSYGPTIGFFVKG